MKYIIDIPDGITCINALKYEDSKCVVARPYIVSDLTPYAEPDEDEIRQKVEDEVWKFAKKIGSFNGLAKRDLDECFGHTTIQGVMTTYDTYKEAKREYEKWKNQKREIRVGDEVIIKSDGVKGVVLDEDLCGEFFVFTENECCETYRKIHFEKTGRRFPEVAELLKKMREK